MTPALPWRRLTAVAATNSLCLVFYEHGGIGKSNNVAAFRISQAGAEPVWHAYLEAGVADPAALRLAIDEKRAVIEAGFFGP